VTESAWALSVGKVAALEWSVAECAEARIGAGDHG
jgi:hypothetical protein